MKHSVSPWLMGVLCLFSCQNELEDLSSDTMMLDNVPVGEMVAADQGLLRQAGYGWNSAKDKRYLSAIEESNVTESFDNIDPLEISVTAVENRDSLLVFVTKNSTISIGIGQQPGGGGGAPPSGDPNPGDGPNPSPDTTTTPSPGDETPLPMPVPPSALAANAEGEGESSGEIKISDISASFDRIKALEEVMTFNERTINVVARIRVALSRYDVSDNPTLNPEAQRYLEEYGLDAFFNRYGTGLISSDTKGGELYFVYSFDVSNSKTVSKRRKFLDARLAVQEVFNLGGSRNDSTATISTSFRELESTSVISSVAGFNTASEIRDQGQADAEADRLLAYLQANPDKATSLDDAKQFLPYAAFIDTPGLAEAWAERQGCVDDYQLWKLAELRLGEAALNPTLEDGGPLKKLAENAARDANGKAGIAGNCNPTEDVRQYKWIADLGATVPLYRFYSEERTNNYYTTNKESVNNIDGGSSYRYVGIACRVFTRNVGGVTWLREYWYNQGDDHRYDTDQARGVQGSNYVYNGEVGYLYANNGVNAIDDRYLEPVYLFYNDEVKDHLITTDPQRESFGSPDGGDGYTFQGTMGYAVSADFELRIDPAF